MTDLLELLSLLLAVAQPLRLQLALDRLHLRRLVFKFGYLVHGL